MTKDKHIAFIVSPVLVFVAGAVLLVGQSMLQSGYYTPGGKVVSDPGKPDVHVGELVPRSLLGELGDRKWISVISCVACSMRNILPDLSNSPKAGEVLVLLQDSSPEHARDLAVKYPSLKFKCLDPRSDLIHPSFTPSLYGVVSKQFKFVQEGPLVDSDYLDQIGK